MKETCGCCEGIHESTPAEIRNRPGLYVLSYRVGTHATFLETMKARLSSIYLKDTEPGGKPFKKEARPYPLGELKTREADDPAIALLDAWSTVADVLTFYQERIANEGYLRTATERRSVLELARLVGYNLRPGVAASTFFAYTLEKDSVVTIPAGSRAQSVPGPGETLQSFETSHDLAARTEWNTLQPRLTEPQAPDRPEEVSGKVLYFKGTATNLKPNDPILIDFGPPRKPPAPQDTRRQELFRVMKVEPDSVADRTKVTLQLWVRPETGTGEAPLEATMKAPAQLAGMSAPQTFALRERVKEIVEHYSDETEFSEILKTSTGKSVAEQLETLRRNLDVAELSRVIEKEVLPKLQEKHRAAIEGNFTRLEPWIQQLITDLEETLASVAASLEVEAAKNIAEVESSTASVSSSAKTPMHATTLQAQAESIATDLKPILSDLEKPPSIPPPNPQRLDRSIEQVFGPKSDITTSLLTALRPALAPLLVKALENQPVTPPQLKVYALRTRASVFGHNAPLQNILEDEGPDKGKVIGQQEWTLVKGASGAPESFNLKIRFLTELSGTTPPRPGFKTKLKIGGAPEIESTLIPTGPQQAEYEFDIHYPQAGEDPIKVKLKVFPIVGGQISFPAAAFNDAPPFILTFDFPTRGVFVTCDFSKVISQVFATNALDPTSVTFNHDDPEFGDDDESFASPPAIIVTDTTLTITGQVLSLQQQATEKARIVALDAPYPQILPSGKGTPDEPESWVALERREKLTGESSPLVISRIEHVGEVSKAEYGLALKTTQLTLEKPWLNPDPLESDEIDLRNNSFDVIRTTAVFVQSELLELAEAPIDPVANPIYGKDIELEGFYSGLETGRWLIITGERVDISSSQPATASTKPALAAIGVSRLRVEAAITSTEKPDAFGVGAAGATGDGQNEEKPLPIKGLKSAELVMLAGLRQGRDPDRPGDKNHTTLILANSLAYKYKRDTVTIYGNVAHATHGETRNEVLGSGDASQPLQTFTLKQPPLTFVSAPTISGIDSTLKVRVNDILWREAESLIELGPKDRRYITRTDDESKTRIIFGNGEQGARLPTGIENITAQYRNGIGKQGNVRAGQISIIATKPLGVKEVVNPLAATGGADKEDRDTGRRNAPMAVMSLDRLVSVQDYEDFVRTFAGIGKASAARLSDGRREVVFLTIAGAEDIPIAETSDLFQNLRLSLSKFGDPFQAVQIKKRLLKLLIISAGVRIHPDYLWEKVEPKIRAALLDTFSFARRELGQDVLLSEVTSTIQVVEGVVYVDVDTLGWVDETITAEDLTKLAEKLEQNPLPPRIAVRMAHIDRLATNPDKRILPAEIAVLSPMVPDTLILKELKA